MLNCASLVLESPKNPTAYRLAAVDVLRRTVAELRDLCEAADLPMSALQARQMHDVTGTLRETINTSHAERLAQALCVTIENELQLKPYFSIAPGKEKYYESVHPFGEAVSQAFPSTSFDAIEAGRCLALGRFTACVFHLMRVLEIGLVSFSAELNLPRGRHNWQQIIQDIEKHIRSIAANHSTRPHDWHERVEFYSQCASGFMFIKDAWRNYTAHARAVYSEEDAETIFINVKAFTQKLASRFSEPEPRDNEESHGN